MIYNENGIIIYSINEKINLEAFDLFIESVNDDEMEGKIKELKEIISQCDKDKLSKIKSMDTKYKFLKGSVKKVLDKIGIINGIGLMGSFVPLAVAANTENKLATKITGSIFAFFIIAFTALCGIAAKSNTNKANYLKEITNLSNETIEKLKQIYNNNKLPKDVRNEAKENIDKIKRIISNNTSSNSKSKYIDFEINGIQVKLSMNEDKYQNNKSFYDTALKTFKSKFTSELNKIRKDLRDFGEGYEDYANGDIVSIELDDSYYGSHVYHSEDIDNASDKPELALVACLYIELSNSHDEDEDCVTVCMIYTKSDKYYTCDWEALG